MNGNNLNYKFEVLIEKIEYIIYWNIVELKFNYTFFHLLSFQRGQKNGVLFYLWTVVKSFIML